MTRPGKSISTCKSCDQILTSIVFLLGLILSSGCSLKAPEDYYLLFRGMEAWGQKNRTATKRTVGDIIEPPEKQQPLVVAFEVGQEPAGFLGFNAIEWVEESEMAPMVKPDGTGLSVELPKVPIAIQDKAFRQVCQEEDINLIHWRPRNGRLENGSNIVQINFMPRGFSDIAIHHDFLLVTAIAYGSQIEKNTIDAIRAIAEDDSGSPVMLLEGSIESYLQYFSGNMDLQGWQRQLQIKKY